MTIPNTERRKLLLCGSNYAASYLPAIEDPSSAFELAGILARGSERSLRLAAAKNVPLWSSAEEVAGGVGVAIVALPPADAATVTRQLIARGVHMLVEHPVAGDVLHEVRERAAAAKVVHNVNCHFAELSAPRAFVQECRRRAALGPMQYVSVVTAARSAYATFDLLGRALGGLSGSSLEQELTSASGLEHPFASYRATLEGLPVRVQCSGTIGAKDDGSDSPVPQRIEVGFEDGNLVLLSPVGPVVWSEKLRLALRNHPGPLWVNLADPSVTFGELLKDRVNANRRALDALHRQIAGENAPAHQSTPWLARVAELTQTVRSTSA